MSGFNPIAARLARFKLNRMLAKLQRLGTGCEIEPQTRLIFPESIEIGDHVYIGPGCYFNGRGGLRIADHVIFAPEVAIMTSMHRHKNAEMIPYDQVELLKPVMIEQSVWIGLRAIIMPGVTIGEGSIVGAGAVVTRSCPPGTILGGNPAREIGRRDIQHYESCKNQGAFYLKRKQQHQLEKIPLAVNEPSKRL